MYASRRLRVGLIRLAMDKGKLGFHLNQVVTLTMQSWRDNRIVHINIKYYHVTF